VQQERRQKAEDRILSHIEEDSFSQGLLHKRTRRNVKHQALNKSASASLASRGIFSYQSLKLLMQIAADAGDVLQQTLFFHRCQILKANAAREWASAKRGAMLPRRNRRSEVLLRKKRSERQSRSDRLCNGHDVGYNAEALEGKDRSRTAKSALNLVEDQSGSVLVGKGAALAQEIGRTLQNAAFAENRFKNDRAGIGIDCGSKLLGAVLLDKGHILKQRFKTLAIFILPSKRHRPKRTAVIGASQGNKSVLSLATNFVSSQARQFDGAFHRFGAAV